MKEGKGRIVDAEVLPSVCGELQIEELQNVGIEPRDHPIGFSAETRFTKARKQNGAGRGGQRIRRASHNSQPRLPPRKRRLRSSGVSRVHAARNKRGWGHV